MSGTEAGPPGEVDGERWRRRLTAGDALSSAEHLRLSLEEAARVADGDERASSVAKFEPPSVRQLDEVDAAGEPPAVNDFVEPLTVNEFTLTSTQTEVGQGHRSDSDLTQDSDLTGDINLSGDIDLTEIDLTDDTAEIDLREVVAGVVEPNQVAAASPRSSGEGRNWKTRATSAGKQQLDVAAVAETPSSGAIASDSVASGRPTDDAADSSKLASVSSEASSHDTERSEGTSVFAPDAITTQSSAAPVLRQPSAGRRSGLLLLLIAVALALLTGLLGTMLVLERSNSSALRAEVERAQEAESAAIAERAEVNNDLRTLQLDNERIEQQLNDMSALVLELPEGRITEIAVPFTPTFADEENGRLIALSADGEFITWGEGASGPITDSGTVSGAPTGLFAAAQKAWVATDAGQIDVLWLALDEPDLPSVEFGPSEFLAAEDRGYWTYNAAAGEVVRLRKSDGGSTAAVSVPVPVVDLAIGAGSVWALGDDGRVYRINTADLTVAPIEAGGDLISITAGPDALWTLSAADGSLRRIDPVTGDVLVTVPVGRDPIDATFAGRSVWVALRSGSSLIEVDTRTAAVVSRTTLPAEPTALHQGDTGVFVTSADPEHPLVRVASTTAAIEQEDSSDESS